MENSVPGGKGWRAATTCPRAKRNCPGAVGPSSFEPLSKHTAAVVLACTQAPCESIAVGELAATIDGVLAGRIRTAITTLAAAASTPAPVHTICRARRCRSLARFTLWRARAASSARGLAPASPARSAASARCSAAREGSARSSASLKASSSGESFSPIASE